MDWLEVGGDIMSGLDKKRSREIIGGFVEDIPAISISAGMKEMIEGKWNDNAANHYMLRLMCCRIGEEHSHNWASYLRWAAAGTLQSSCDHQPLHGISEYIRIRPAIYGSFSNSKHRQHHIRHHDGDYLGDYPAL